MLVTYVIVKTMKIFENSFLKNGILAYWSEALIDSILSYSSDDNYVHNQKMFLKILITNFNEKSRK